MALNSYAQLSLNGTALSGDVAVAEMGGVDVSADHIEVNEVRWGAAVPATSTTARYGKPELQPIVLLKRVDQTTPMLYQGLFTNMSVDGDIKLFEPDPDNGNTRHRFTIKIAKARIRSIASWSPDTLDPAELARPAREVVTIAAASVNWRDEVYGTEYQRDSAAR
jgi:type VI secretion system secreted protein Hcp